MMTIGGGGKMGPSIGRPCGGGNKKKKMRKREEMEWRERVNEGVLEQYGPLGRNILGRRSQKYPRLKL